jgi:cytochrome c oxidase subunit 1
MFVAGQSMYASIVFSLLSFMIGVFSAIKVFNWTASLYKGDITFSAPMIYALGFVGLFMLGGLTGIFVAAIALDVGLTDTYFVVSHFHYIMVGGSVMAYLGGIHFWWPKITGRMYPEMWARFAAILMFFGFNLTFFPQYLLGTAGMPRRYQSYAPQFQVLNVLSSAGASLLAVAYLMPLAYLLWSLRYGARAGRNPWKAAGLEWKTSSPPPLHNFPEPPLVEGGPYDYPVPTSDVRAEQPEPAGP